MAIVSEIDYATLISYLERTIRGSPWERTYEIPGLGKLGFAVTDFPQEHPNELIPNTKYSLPVAIPPDNRTLISLQIELPAPLSTDYFFCSVEVERKEPSSDHMYRVNTEINGRLADPGDLPFPLWLTLGLISLMMYYGIENFGISYTNYRKNDDCKDRLILIEIEEANPRFQDESTFTEILFVTAETLRSAAHAIKK